MEPQALLANQRDAFESIAGLCTIKRVVETRNIGSRLASVHLKRVFDLERKRATEGTRQRVTQSVIVSYRMKLNRLFLASSSGIVLLRTRVIFHRNGGTYSAERGTERGDENVRARASASAEYPASTRTNSPLSDIIQKLPEGIRYS